MSVTAPISALGSTARGSTAPSGTISTVIGGVGGPGLATKVAVGPGCIMIAGSNVYLGDQGSVRAISMATDRLTTVAGVRVVGSTGDGGLATNAELFAGGMATDHAGNLLLTDSNKIRVVAARNGSFYGRAMVAKHIYTIAGTGVQGFSGDGGPAVKAELSNPEGVAVDHAGNVVITDSFNQRVRLIAARTGTFYGQHMTAGDIYTVAGNGTAGFAGDGGPATSAETSSPDQIAVDANGNLVFGDVVNNRVRVVAEKSGTFFGQKMTTGDIYTIAGNGIGGFFGNGGPGTAAELNEPTGVAVDAGGNVVIADSFNRTVRVLAARTGSFYGQQMTTGDIYGIAGNGNFGFSGDGGPATQASLSDNCAALDSAGNVVIADGFNDRVRVVAVRTATFYGRPMTAGDIYTVAGNGFSNYSGDGGSASSGELQAPSGAGVTATGATAVADSINNTIRFVPASSGTFFGRSMRGGDIYTVAGNGTFGFGGDGGPGIRALLRNPLGVGVDAAGNLLISDTQNARIRVLAARTGTFYGLRMTAGNIYTVAGNGTFGFSGDGGPATNAMLFNPSATVVDHAGNLVITDSGNSRIRVVAARGGTFYGQKMTAGDIYTVAGDGNTAFSGDGGPAISAGINGPFATAVDRIGNLVVTDTGNNRVRVVAVRTGTFYGIAMTAGDIYTIAGDGTGAFSGDGGPAVKAALHQPTGVIIDRAGNVVVSDAVNNRVRVVAIATGTFYGIAMTAGDIYTIGGTGFQGFGGDGGRGTSAALNQPLGLALTGGGGIAVSDMGNNRIRVISP